MLKLLLLLNLSIVSFSSATLAQQPTEPLEKVLPIRGFTTLNTTSGLFGLKPSEGVIGINLDLSLNPGSLTKRFGIEAVDTMLAVDSILGIYGAQLSDGRQYFVVVVDDSNSSVGSVRVGYDNKFNLDSLTTLRVKWPITSKPSFGMIDDQLFVTNEYSRAVVWNGRKAQVYPIQAPGELLAVPTSTSGNVDGVVRYVILRRGSLKDIGYISQPISVRNKQVLLYGLSKMPYDSFITSTPAEDTLWIYRTRGNVQPLDNLDTVWFTGTKAIVTSANQWTLTATDTTSESYMTSTYASTAKLLLRIQIPRGDTSLTDSSGGQPINGEFIRPTRYGAPGYISSDTVKDSSGTAASTAPGGIWRKSGNPASGSDTTSARGFVWYATFEDTVTGQSSDTGPGTWMLLSDVYVNYNDNAERMKLARRTREKVRLALPESSDSTVICKLWRARVRARTFTQFDGRARDPFYGPYSYVIWRPDSVALDPLYLIGEYSPGDTVYDSLRYDSLIGRTPFVTPRASGVLSYLRGLFEFSNRLWGFDNQRVYYSSLDTTYRFGAFNNIAISPNDGDVLVAVVPTPDGVLALKSRSSYLIYEDANGDWNRTQVSSYTGCIAPRSVVKSPRGLYYLSDNGVVFQSTGQYRERAPSIQEVSGPLEQLRTMSTSVLSGAVGAYYDEKYFLGIGDTTYLYSERTGGWTTLEFGISAATSYAVETSADFIPLDSMYFIMSGNGKRVWKYGGGEIDSGYQSDFVIADGPPTWVWRTVPLLAGPGYKSITKIGLYGSGGSSDQFEVKLYDETGTEVSSKTVTGIDGKYVEVGFPPTTAKFYQIQIASSGIVSTGRTVIDGMDVYYTENGNIDIK